MCLIFVVIYIYRNISISQTLANIVKTEKTQVNFSLLIPCLQAKKKLLRKKKVTAFEQS